MGGFALLRAKPIQPGESDIAGYVISVLFWHGVYRLAFHLYDQNHYSNTGKHLFPTFFPL